MAATRIARGDTLMGLFDRFRKHDRPTGAPAPQRQSSKPPQRPAPAVRITNAKDGPWIPTGGTTSIAGRQIAGGFVYVGGRLKGVSGDGVEPALIDPSLKVDWGNPDWAGAGLDYWPSYTRIPARSRAAYLSWLTNGRSHPVPIGYVFLFFYGLERRAIVDLNLDNDQPELAAIAAEVRRLLGLYGSSGSFERYATDFLELLSAAQSINVPLTPPDLSTLQQTWEVPMVVRVALGRYVAADQPIPAAWALTLLRTHPEGYLRTPATRCAAEFDDLFKFRYAAKFGGGLRVPAPRERLQLVYQPASDGFRGQVAVDLSAIPDITKVSGLITRLRDLGAECTDELDAYSRFIGRNPDAGGTPAAVGLLPNDLLTRHGGMAIDALHTWVTAAVEAGPALVAFDDVVQRWSPGRTSKLAKAEAVSVAGLLAKLGVGIEPDVRFGASTPAPGSTAVLFPQPPAAPAAPTSAYAAASMLVHLTAVVAATDGSVTDAERHQVAEHLEATLGLDAVERARLEAHLQWLTAGKPALTGLKKRLDALTDAQRGTIGAFLVDVAAADGQVTRDEITTLTKVYRLLGLDEADVYRSVHALGSGEPGLPTARPASDAKRWSIPPEPAAPVGPVPVRLDPARVQARLAETATVAALLADIFTDDDETPVAPTPAGPSVKIARRAGEGPPETDLVDGLDVAHTALARRLGNQASWSRADAEDVAAGLGLPLLDGALDRINEAALDVCGEPLVDGDDPLETNDYAAGELFQ